MADDVIDGVGGENRKTQLVNNNSSSSDDDDKKRPPTDLPRGDTPLA